MANSADPDQLASDLDLHCLLKQGMLCSASEGLIFSLFPYLAIVYHYLFLIFPSFGASGGLCLTTMAFPR